MRILIKEKILSTGIGIIGGLQCGGTVKVVYLVKLQKRSQYLLFKDVLISVYFFTGIKIIFNMGLLL